jgi:glyoxylase-like metal-dependent hydrolase (beta-lactamase superfamily II)
MNNVDILIEGYARVFADRWEASSSTVLIKTPQLTIIIDPGCNRELLLKKLKAQKVAPEEVNVICLTHTHLDHSLNVALFPKARVINNEGVYQADIAYPVGECVPDTDIKIVQTPGHVLSHCSYVIPTEKGNVIVAGDVFWWLDGEEQHFQVNKEDEFADDMEQLRLSREQLLSIGGLLIPGHGKPILI